MNLVIDSKKYDFCMGMKKSKLITLEIKNIFNLCYMYLILITYMW